MRLGVGEEDGVAAGLRALNDHRFAGGIEGAGSFLQVGRRCVMRAETRRGGVRCRGSGMDAEEASPLSDQAFAV